MSTSSESGIFFVWTARMPSRPFTSGRLTTMRRSKRPGRSSAGSRTSGRLVAAIRMTPSFDSKPSISTSSWLSVCSRSSWPPPSPAPRCRPTASISSMKTMHGAFFLPCSNRSRTRDAPTPTNISTKSDPLIEKNGTLASPATARASSVLPVPGEPMSSTPLGMRPPSFWNFCGSRRNSMISWSSSFASSAPATSLERHLLLRARRQLRPALAERQGLVPAALHLPHDEDPEADHQDDRRPGEQNGRPRARVLAAGRDDDALLGQLVGQTVVARRDVRREALRRPVARRRRELAGDLVASEDHLGDVVLVDSSQKVGKRNLAAATLEVRRELPDERQDDHEGHPEQQALQG